MSKKLIRELSSHWDQCYKVTKRDKNKAKDLNHIEYYTCKQKGYYASRYLKKIKKLVAVLGTST